MTHPIHFSDAVRVVLLALLCAVWSAGRATAQETVIRGFADVTFDVADDDGNNQFGIGQFDLFLASQLSEKVSFLGEIVFESEGDGFIVDVERMQITYRVSPSLSISVGKQHSPIGYWNTEYHHGSLLEPTIDRPLMFLFEDEGGVLPIHITGIRASGRDIGPASLGFDVMIGNGIGATSVDDNDAEKAFTGQFFTQVTPLFRLGASVYTDHLSRGIETLQGGSLAEDLRQTMSGPFVAYTSSQLELQVEYLRIWNQGASVTTTTDAGYVYVGVRMGDLVPYARYDLISYPNQDAYFPADDLRQGLVGIRLDLSAPAVLKSEIRWARTGNSTIVSRFVVQIAIAF